MPRPFWRDEGGASAVEFAIVGSVLIVICLATIQLGWALQIRNEMSKATDEAARHTLLPGKSETDFSGKVKEVLAGYDQDRLVIPAPQSMTFDGVPVWVYSVTYEMPIVVPGLPTNIGEITVSRRTPDL